MVRTAKWKAPEGSPGSRVSEWPYSSRSGPIVIEGAQDPTKNTQWDAFLRKSQLEAPPFPEVIARISPFLLPLLDPETGKEVSSVWSPEDGWISPSKPD